MTTPRRPVRRLAVAGMLLALVGVWVGHAAEYLRTGGRALAGPGLPGAVHPYMLPVAALLLVVAALGAAGLWRAWLYLGWRMARARAGIEAVWRGRRPVHAVAQADSLPPFGCRLAALWPALAAVQIAIYLLQENLEARSAGLPMPGLGPVTGVHWAAPLVHLSVAFVLAGGAAAVLALFRRRARVIAFSERLLRALVGTVAPRSVRPAGGRGWTPSPVDRFGTHILRRPPPRLTAA